MKQGKFPKKIFKKKAYCIIAIGAFLVTGTAVFAVSVRAKGAQKNAAQTSVQSTAVTKGSISNTIDASGNLEAAQIIDITVPTGIKVEKISVESGEEVTKGQTLAKLNKTSVTRLLVDVKDSLEAIDDELDKSGLSSLEKEELEGERDELKKTEKKLTALYKKPVITASANGIIGTIYISENAETSNSASSTGSGLSGSDGQSSSLTQLTSETTEELLFLTADLGADTSASMRTVSTADSEAELKTVTDYSDLSIQAPVTGEAPQKSIKETGSYTGTISWNCSGSAFQSGTVYTATIVLTAKSGYTFSEKNLPIIKEASFNWSISHSGEGNTLKLIATYEKTSDSSASGSNSGGSLGDGSDSDSNSGSENGSESNPGSNNSDGSGSAGSSSDGAGNNSGSNNSGTSGHTNGIAGGAKSGNIAQGASGGTRSGSVPGGSSGNISGNISGGASGSTSGSSYSSASSSEYSSYEAVAFTIAKQDSAKIVVNVDELDILSVEKDQPATVTLDALENEEYTGTVTKISNTASAGSGSTKYEVEITVPMDENMRIGMSASAAIQISSSEDTLLLPMTALQQRGDKTFVYTQKDKDGNLSGEVTVETGLSDGQNAEILNGLTEGTEVYYTRTASGDESDAGSMFPGSMDGMNGIGGAGGMDGNGGMPGTPPDGGRNHSDSDGSRGGTGRNGGSKPSGN